jgi:hypothetical protein
LAAGADDGHGRSSTSLDQRGGRSALHRGGADVEAGDPLTEEIDRTIEDALRLST